MMSKRVQWAGCRRQDRLVTYSSNLYKGSLFQVLESPFCNSYSAIQNCTGAALPASSPLSPNPPGWLGPVAVRRGQHISWHQPPLCCEWCRRALWHSCNIPGLVQGTESPDIGFSILLCQSHLPTPRWLYGYITVHDGYVVKRMSWLWLTIF